MQKISPVLWFEHEAEEAVGFYVSVFDDAEITDVSRPPGGGEAIHVGFRLAGQEFMALNGRRADGFTEAVSLYVRCHDQAEVDRFWTRLTDGGEPSMCGWLVDRFGVSWQIVPDRLGELLGDPDQARAQRALQAMLGMQKIDIAALEAAADAA